MRFLKRIIIAAVLLNSAVAIAGTAVTIYKSPTCGCCENYIDYLKENGFSVKTIQQEDMASINRRYGVTRVASCHTALIDGYVVEGHVPVHAINRLLGERPAIAGISVPGMKKNSPGMGTMEKGTLTVYIIPKAGEEPAVFSVE